MKAIRNFFNNTLRTPTWLFFLLLAVIILRIPTLFEPYSYGDEMIYLTLGEGVRQGIPLYSGLHDNKPPLLYLTAALAGNLFWFRAILLIWSVLTIFIFYKFANVFFSAKKVSTKNKIQRVKYFAPVSTVIFSLLTTLPFWEGNIANAENFMIGLTIFAFYLVWVGTSKMSYIFSAGLLLSFASLFKIPAAFDLPAIILLWIFTVRNWNRKEVINILKKSTYLIVGFLLPILISLVWYYLQGAFKEYLIAAYLQNVGYLSSFRPDDVQKSFLERNAPLILRASVVAIGILFLFIQRKKLSKQFLLSTSWLLLTLFAITLSERPYPHYLLQSAASAALLGGMFFTIRNMEQLLVIIPLALLFFVPKYYQFWGYPTLSYYTRFINYAAGNISKDKYIESYGGNVTRAYNIAQYVVPLTKPSERIFVWGDSSLIYALSKRLPPIRYTAGYHIKDFSSAEEIVAELKQNPPKFIIILPGEELPSLLQIFLSQDYGQVETVDEAEVWLLLSPRIRSLIHSET